MHRSDVEYIRAEIAAQKVHAVTARSERRLELIHTTDRIIGLAGGARDGANGLKVADESRGRGM